MGRGWTLGVIACLVAACGDAIVAPLDGAESGTSVATAEFAAPPEPAGALRYAPVDTGNAELVARGYAIAAHGALRASACAQ